MSKFREYLEAATKKQRDDGIMYTIYKQLLYLNGKGFGYGGNIS